MIDFEWKMKAKKKLLEKMPRKKWGENAEYQGEEKDAKRDGFGTLLFTSGKYKG